MKRIYVALFGVISLCCVHGQVQAISISTEYGFGADAFVAAYDPTSNFSNGTTVNVKNASPDPSGIPYFRKGYFRFDLSAVGTTMITDATFFLTIGDYSDGDSVSGTQTFNVFGLLDGDPGEEWDSSQINWNNAPANGSDNAVLSNATLLGNFSFNGNGNAGDIVTLSGGSLVSFLNDDTNGLATLILVRETFDPNVSGYVHNFAAAEHLSLAPPTLDLDFGLPISPVPEPATMLLFASGLAGLAAVGRRRKS